MKIPYLDRFLVDFTDFSFKKLLKYFFTQFKICLKHINYFLGCLMFKKLVFHVKYWYFWCFLTFLDDFARSQKIVIIMRSCVGVQELRKIKITKNEPKHPQITTQCHIGRFKVHDIGLGIIRANPFPPIFGDFWRYFELILINLLSFKKHWKSAVV